MVENGVPLANGNDQLRNINVTEGVKLAGSKVLTRRIQYRLLNFQTSKEGQLTS